MNCINNDILTEYFTYDDNVATIVNKPDSNTNIINKDNVRYMVPGKLGTRYYRQKTQEEFIDDAKLKHGDRYDYNRVIYKNNSEKVEIICRVHGSFFQQAGSHLYGTGCPKCAIEYSKSRKKLTLDQVIQKFKSVHKDKYDYSNIIEYVNNHTKMPIRCYEHGIFHMSYKDHVNDVRGCNKCKLETITGRRLGNGKCDYNWFIDNSKKTHGDRYNYSKVNYTSSREKVEIICSVHGSFWQNAYSHAKGIGCPRCSGKHSYNTHEYLELVKNVHGDRYDYSKTVYGGNKVPIIIVCKKHGEFKQRPHNHLRGEGCNKCGKESMSKGRQLTYDQFINKAQKVHKNRYKYLGFDGEYTTVDHTIIRVMCKKHGEFKQKVHPHLGGAGCPSCNSSRGEYRIKCWLDENDINYETQKVFDGCINNETNRKLKFDFYIPEKNLIVEFDGKQHFEMSNFCNDIELAKQSFEKTKKHDVIKNKFAKKHKINILRISYKQFKKIDEILKQFLIKK